MADGDDIQLDKKNVTAGAIAKGADDYNAGEDGDMPGAGFGSHGDQMAKAREELQRRIKGNVARNHGDDEIDHDQVKMSIIANAESQEGEDLNELARRLSQPLMTIRKNGS